MKRVFVFALSALLFANAALAEKITENEAKAVASKFFNSSSAVRKASGNGQTLSLAGASTGYYIFNRGTSAGYVIVAADDRAADMVLGYADEGTVDMSAMPENMAWWLAEYDRQMASVTQSKAAAIKPAAAKLKSIAPIVTAKWDQSTPYNDLCPVQHDTVCPSGCVATAMSQIMYYHKWPEKGVGSHAYNWNGEVLSADFGNTTYNWNAMTDKYDNNSTDSAKSAVATLMHDVGISVNMYYAAKASGTFSTYVDQALLKYFNYDKNIKYLDRSYYGLTEWMDIIYRELAASRPVYYAGVSEDNKNAHAFVCDGYRDGYFHINWGWGGINNGYFLLSVLAPEQQGIGGSTSGYGFSQEAVVNIQKPQENTVVEPYYLNKTDFSTSKSQAALSETLTFKGLFYNAGFYASTVNWGLMVVSAADDTTYVAGNSGSYQSGSGTGMMKISLEQFPKTEGVYSVYPAYQDSNTKTWYKINTISSANGSLAATVSGSNVTFAKPEEGTCQLTVSDFAASSTLYTGKRFTATVNLGDTGAEYFGKVYLYVMNVDASTYVSVYGTTIDIDDGMTQKYSLTGIAPDKAGSYELLLTDWQSNPISERIPVTVVEAPSGKVGLKLVNQLRIANPTAVSADNVSVSAVIRGTSGLFDNNIALGFFRNGNDESSDMITQKAIIGSGDEVTLTFEGELPSAEVGDKYQAAIYYLDNNAWTRMPAIGTNYNRLSFTIGSLTGINSVSSASASGTTHVYTLSGTLVGTYKATNPDLKSLPKGLYVVKRGAEVKKVRN